MRTRSQLRALRVGTVVTAFLQNICRSYGSLIRSILVYMEMLRRLL